MKRLILLMVIPTLVLARDEYDLEIGFGGYKDDGYGMGVHSDPYGRAFTWERKGGGADPLMRVKPNSYGLGVHVDQYGNPVTAVPFGGR